MHSPKLVCYTFTFVIAARSKVGKVYKAHRVKAVGLSYSLALWDMIDTLRRRGMQLNKINNVSVDSIEFAFDPEGNLIRLNLADHMPYVPLDYDDVSNTSS